MFHKLTVIASTFLIIFSLSLSPLNAYAQVGGDGAVAVNNLFGYNGGATTAVGAKTVNPDKLVETISNIANTLVLIVAAISVIFIVYGAFLWMTKGQKEGQAMVTNAVIGLIIAVIAFFIVQLAVGAANQISSTKTLD